MFIFDMGQNVEDLVTGFKGAIAGRHEWITGCNSYTVQPRIMKNGEVPETRSIDETRLKLISGKVELPEREIKKNKGGPQSLGRKL